MQRRAHLRGPCRAAGCSSMEGFCLITPRLPQPGLCGRGFSCAQRIGPPSTQGPCRGGGSFWTTLGRQPGRALPWVCPFQPAVHPALKAPELAATRGSCPGPSRTTVGSGLRAAAGGPREGRPELPRRRAAAWPGGRTDRRAADRCGWASRDCGVLGRAARAPRLGPVGRMRKRK